MANEIKEAVLSFSEKQLKLLKMYLPYVVIVALAWGYFKKDKEVDMIRSEEKEHMQKDIDFAKEAYEKSNETYYFIVNRLKDEKQNQGR
jgi:hypothetical protein